METISGFHRDDDQSWIVSLEVLELERVPSTMDILATYCVTLSEDGDVLGFERRGRFSIADVDLVYVGLRALITSVATAEEHGLSVPSGGG